MEVAYTVCKCAHWSAYGVDDVVAVGSVDKVRLYKDIQSFVSYTDDDDPFDDPLDDPFDDPLDDPFDDPLDDAVLFTGHTPFSNKAKRLSNTKSL